MKQIPLHSLVIMIGPTKGGKSFIAKKHFNSYEILSYDDIKIALVGDSSRQDINKEINIEISRRVKLKLRLGERVVIDAPNIKLRDRTYAARLGEDAGVPVFFIVCNRSLEDKKKIAGNSIFVEQQQEIFSKNEQHILQGDGIAEVVDTRIVEFKAIQKFNKGNIYTEIKKRKFKGITVIGDIHGMRYSLKSAINWATSRSHFIIFLGDVIDYGPKTLECFEDVYDIVMAGDGVLIYGNHERKIDRWIDQEQRGNVTLNLSDGNKVTIDALNKLTYYQKTQFKTKFKGLMKMCRNHYIVENILFTHGAGHPDMWNKEEIRLRDHKLSTLACFGEIDNSLPPRKDGNPNRVYNWCEAIPKNKICIVGHDIRSTGAPFVVKNKKGGESVFLDTGSGKSGGLSSADIRFKANEPLKINHFNRH